ncbi:DUF3868 domain-containing protein [Bacteroides fragilis]|nr:DUF3868 domain-containing protein [Bacteroides fragilis]
MLDITFSVCPRESLESQEVTYLLPVYVSADGRDSIRLEPVCVSGKRRYKVIKRRKALGNLKPDTPGSLRDPLRQRAKKFGPDGEKECPLREVDG